MTVSRLAHEDLLRALSELRLPPRTAVELAADLCAALALALVSALVVAALARPLLARRPPPPPPPASPDDREDLRRLRLVKRLAAIAPEEVAAYRDALYRPDAAFEEAALRRRLAALGEAGG